MQALRIEGRIGATLCSILFASGAAGLVFETLWFHQASLAFGSSVWASSLVLSGFMAGLAGGSLLAGRFGDGLARPVRAYGLLEILVAVGGVLLVVLIPRIGPALGPWLGTLADRPWVLNPLRFAVVFALLLVPSTAMGATLPLLTQALVAVNRDFPQALGRLYGWNTLGAVAGTLLAAGPLVAWVGVRGTSLVAAGFNAVAALAALVLASRWPVSRDGASPRVATTREIAGAVLRQPALAAAAAGFAFLALEVVWFRLLLLFVPGTSMAFAWMLAVALSGIAAGGLVASRWVRGGTQLRPIANAIAWAAGAAIVVGYAMLGPASRHVGFSYVEDAGRTLVLAATLMLPAALLSGAFFVSAGAVLRERVASAAVAAGALTFANTVGAAVGALVAGFVLLPRLGIERSLLALVAVYALVGLSFLGRSQRGRLRTWLVAAALAGSFLIFPFGYLKRDVMQSVIQRRQRGMEQRLVEMREGPLETLAYVENVSMGRPHSYTLVTNGFGMSDTHWFAQRYMKLYVYLPVALNPEIRTALLISYGVGSTARALTDTRALRRIDVVDISRDVLELNRIVYPDPADFPLNDSRVRVFVEDGRYFLETTPERYDLITAEPPPPRLAGVVNLYTRDYFSLIRRRLNEGGYATYWLPVHALTNPASLSIVRGFCDVFDDCSLWSSGSHDLMLVGSRDAPGGVRSAAFARQWQDPDVAPELVQLGFERPEQLGALFIGGPDHLAEIAGSAAALTDDFPRRILLPGPRGDEPTALRAGFIDTDAARRRFAASELIARLWPPDLRQASLRYFDSQRAIHSMGYSLPQTPVQRIAELHRIQTETDLQVLPLWLMGSDARQQAIAREVIDRRPYPNELGFHLAAGAIAMRDFETGADLMGGHRSRHPEDLRAGMLEIYALGMAGRTGEVERRLVDWREILERHAPDYPAWVRGTFPD